MEGLPFELDPMLGHGCFVVDSDLEVLAASCVDVEFVDVEPVEPVEPVVAAEAPAIPTAVPPVASAPATIVAVSILEMCIGLSLPVDGCGDAVTHHP